MHLFFGFSGRIGRLQWWLGQLASLGLITVAVLLVSMTVDVEALNDASRHTAGSDLSWSAALLIIAVSLLLSWISLALSVKRFHDRDKSGWWVLINLVPYLGALWLLVECGFLPGSDGSNHYGPPSGGGASDWSSDIDVSGPKSSLLPVSAPAVPAVRAVQPTARARATGPSTFGRRGG